MSFGRHRIQSEIKPVIKETMPELIEKAIQEIKSDEDSEALAEITKRQKVVESVVKEARDQKHKIKMEQIAKSEKKAIDQKHKVEKEHIERLAKRERKKRSDKKENVPVGIIGNTVECRDFRAIIKKKGEQINTVLTKILHDWNTKNYNL